MKEHIARNALVALVTAGIAVAILGLIMPQPTGMATTSVILREASPPILPVENCLAINGPWTWAEITQDINSTGDCIIINGPYTILDCAGHQINHSKTTTGAGIRVNASNVTIRDCDIWNEDRAGTHGIIAGNASNLSISEVRVRSAGSGSAGILLDNISGSFIERNDFSANGSGANAMVLKSSQNNDFTLNNLSAPGTGSWGLFAQSSSDNDFGDSLFRNVFGYINATAGVYLEDTTLETDDVELIMEDIDGDTGIVVGSDTIILANNSAYVAAFPGLNSSTRITFNEIHQVSPHIMRDSGDDIWRECDECDFISYSDGVFIVDVPHFTNYSVQDSILATPHSPGIVNEDLTLKADINSTGVLFTINASGITLDCDGHTLNYSQAEQEAIRINVQSDVRIVNCVIINAAVAYAAVNVTDSENITVRNVTIYDNSGGAGLQFVNSSRCTIEQNNINVYGSSISSFGLNDSKVSEIIGSSPSGTSGLKTSNSSGTLYKDMNITDLVIYYSDSLLFDNILLTEKSGSFNMHHIEGSNITLRNLSFVGMNSSINWRYVTFDNRSVNPGDARTGYNSVFLDSAAVPELDNVATIRLRETPYKNPEATVDLQDDASWITCPPDVCTNASFKNNNLTFTTMHFTNFSSQLMSSILNVTLGGYKANITIDQGKTINLSAWLSKGEGTITITVNSTKTSTLVATGYNMTSVMHKFNDAGIFIIVVEFAGNENWSNSNSTWRVNVREPSSGGGGRDRDDYWWECEPWGPCDQYGVTRRECTDAFTGISFIDNRQCITPLFNVSCFDGVQNDGETGRDCGGPCPDCPADAFAPGTETATPEPSCSDGIQNSEEAGVDCGGLCEPCPVPEATCGDGIQNSEERGIDCEGPCEMACPSCGDGIQNQGELGIDCGGPCPACPEPEEQMPALPPEEPKSSNIGTGVIALLVFLALAGVAGTLLITHRPKPLTREQTLQKAVDLSKYRMGTGEKPEEVEDELVAKGWSRNAAKEVVKKAR